MITTTIIAQNLRGLAFPCRREECVRYAREHNTPSEVIDLLGQMPERRFDSMVDVWSALGEVY